MDGMMRFKTGVIYLIETKCNNRFIKIGHTTLDPWDRLRTLQTANPVDLSLVRIWIADLDCEKSLLNYLNPFRIRGEWFHNDPEVHDRIREFFTQRKVREISPNQYNNMIWNNLFEGKGEEMVPTRSGKRYLKLNSGTAY